MREWSQVWSLRSPGEGCGGAQLSEETGGWGRGVHASAHTCVRRTKQTINQTISQTDKRAMPLFPSGNPALRRALPRYNQAGRPAPVPPIRTPSVSTETHSPLRWRRRRRARPRGRPAPSPMACWRWLPKATCRRGSGNCRGGHGCCVHRRAPRASRFLKLGVF